MNSTAVRRKSELRLQYPKTDYNIVFDRSNRQVFAIHKTEMVMADITDRVDTVAFVTLTDVNEIFRDYKISVVG